MADNSDDLLVETEWLAGHLDAPDIVILDCTWHLSDDENPRDAHAEYLSEHIPGALFFDIDEIADSTSPLPHMLPSPEKFSSRMRRMGIGDGVRVVVYDTYGLFSAARVWWTFRVMGSNAVSILNGGFAKWKAENRPVESLPPPKRTEKHFTARRDAALVSSAKDVLAGIDKKTAQIVDARSRERFMGIEKEPRQGLRSGHIPGSLNLYYGDLINADGTFKAKDELNAAVDKAGIDLSRPVITSCGSGITASILSFAFALLGHPNASLYDGSWAEWGADETLPIEK